MKRLFLFISFIFLCIAAFSQATTGTRVTAPIVPNDSSDVYPTHDAYFGRDGYRSVITLTERDNIKTALRKEGMLVYVKEDSTIYQLRAGITNINWFKINLGASGDTTLYTKNNLIITTAGYVYTFRTGGTNTTYTALINTYSNIGNPVDNRFTKQNNSVTIYPASDCYLDIAVLLQSGSGGSGIGSVDSTKMKSNYQAGLDSTKLHNQIITKLETTGTAANSSLLQGRDSVYIKSHWGSSSVDSTKMKSNYQAGLDSTKLHNQIITKLPTTGTAANSSLLQGRDSAYIKSHWGGISGLSQNQLLYGKSDGTINQNANIIYNDTALQINAPINFTTTGQKLVFIGNSFTLGTGSSNTYHRFSSIASRLLSGYGYVEDNRGVGGTILSVNYVPTKTSLMEFLIIQYGTNEAGYGWGLQKYADSLKSVILSAIAKGWTANKIVLVSAPYVNYGSGSYPTVLLQGYTKSNDSLANVYGCTPVDIYTPFLDNIYAFLPKATVHPNDMGHELIGYAVAGSIQSTFDKNAAFEVNKQAIFNNININKRRFITKGQLLGIDELGNVGIIHNLEPNTQVNGALLLNNSLLQKTSNPLPPIDTLKDVVFDAGTTIYQAASSAYGKFNIMKSTGDTYLCNGYTGGNLYFQTAPVSTNTFVTAMAIAPSGLVTFSNGFSMPLNKLISSSNGIYTCDFNLIDASYYTNLRNLAPTGAFQFYLSNGGTNTPILMNKIFANGHSIFQSGGSFVDIASSRLTINSTTEGVLLPRMTTTQRDAISSPEEGIEIYNLTDHAKQFFNGTVWKTITTN